MVQKEEIRGPTRIEDVIERIAKAKWEWARHVPRGDEEKWTDKLMQWKPRTSAVKGKCWVHDIKKVNGPGIELSGRL